MRRSIVFPLIFPLLIALFAACESSLNAQPVKGTIITVNDVGDTLDASPGDGICADAAGKCTLRAAIAESNATSTITESIIFDVPIPAVITLNIGELKITSPTAIYGRGARNLTVQRNLTPNFSNFRVFNIAATTVIRGLTIKNGNSFTSGGGILATAEINLADVAITGNNARSGGGIAFQSSEEIYPSIDRCLINSNTASAQGGGMYVAVGTYPIVKNSTFTSNSAVSSGAMANYGGLTLVNDTIARNAATQSISNILNGSGGFVMVLNTIIGPDIGQTVSSLGGQFNSEGSNFVTNTTGSSGFNGPADQTSTNNAIDPLLGNLANNGGQTDSLALMAGSPAINKGDGCVVFGGCFGIIPRDLNLRRDQRKFARQVGRIDIGAYESNSSLDSGTFTTSLFFGQTHRIAYSRVTIINTETMERRSSFIALQDTRQGLRGGTPPLSFDVPGVYLAEVQTKRSVVFSPQLFDY